MQQHRKALADLLRPRLKPPGFNDGEFRRKFFGLLTAAGVPEDPEPIAEPPPIGAPVQLPGLGLPIDPDVAMVDVELLKVACPEAPREQLSRFVGPIRSACQAFEINSIRRVAAYVTQMAHESCGFTRMEENLNYSAKRLAEVWPSRFASGGAPNALAKRIERDPQAIANYVYANRMGNGPPESGDGWRFRGGGPLQVTGADNWRAFAEAMGMPLDQALAWGRTVEGGIMAAAWFWETNDINRLADTPGVSDETKRINGGQHGLADRTARFDRVVAEMLRRERLAVRP